MTKTVIIPDIHTKFGLAEIIIEKEEPDNVVFLGDYFDSFGDNMEIANQTAVWLKESLEKPNRIHLLGNHDLSYLNRNYMCSGFTEEKFHSINQTGIDLTKLQNYCWVGDWLCTHAGLSYEFYKTFAGSGQNVSDFIETFSKDESQRFRLYACSSYRGGQDPYSGIVWCDYDEFVDIPDVKQIFGHTRGSLRQTENHICLDTGLQNYIVYENDVLTVKEKKQ